MKGIVKQFGNFYALKKVDFEAYPGKVNVLIGENGAGKSTLMKIIAGAFDKDDGDILLEGKKVDIRNPLDAEKLGIGTVYQELMLVPELSVAENIFLGRDLKTGFLGRVKWKSIYKEAKVLVKELLGVDIDPHIKVKDLGIAQQQMIEVARVLNRNIKVLIMDEPTAALTEKEIQMLFLTIKKLVDKGIAIIYISHRLEEIFQIGDNITVLRDGELVGHLDAKNATYNQLITMMVGREINDQFPRENFDHIPKEEVLRVEGLTKEGVFKDISFSLHKGEILGFAGLMGAGRTEIVRAIFGADKLDSGKIFIRGKEVNISSTRAAILNGMALLPEDRKSQGLVLIRSIIENITVANLKRISRKFGFLNKRKEILDVDNSIEMLRIAVPNKFNKANTLSGGNQQKLVIAKWVYADSEIMILDEPTRGIDVGAKTEVCNIINKFVLDGKAVLFISSELPEILGICTRILVVKNGELKGEFDNNVSQETILESMIGGKAL